MPAGRFSQKLDLEALGLFSDEITDFLATSEPETDVQPLPNQLHFFWAADEPDASDPPSAPQDGSVEKPAEKKSRRRAGKAATETPAESVDPAKAVSETASEPPAAPAAPPNDPSFAQDASTARISKKSTPRSRRKAAREETGGSHEPTASDSPEKPPLKKSLLKNTSTKKLGKNASPKAMKKKKTSRKKPVTGKPTASADSNSSVDSAEPTSATADSGAAAAVVPPTDLSDSVECISMKWGARLPKVGFGFWKVEQDRTADVCRTAIEVGYRHLDCACDYGNETEVGLGIAQAIRDGLCERSDLWVTSKLWNTYHAPEHVQAACERSLNDLGLEYLDLYLIHFPIAQRFVPFETRYPPGWFFNPDAPNPHVEEARVPIHETWQAMEELAKSGLVRNIGICNFGTSQIRDLLACAHIRPAVLQVETHPYLTQEKLLRYCQQERIVYTAFSPLGAQSYFSLGMADPSEAVMENAVVKRIAAETSRTPAQVLLRWGVQRGTAVIPKTSSQERMIENISIFDFELSDAQMQEISALDQGRRFNDPGHFGEAAFNTFLPIYE